MAGGASILFFITVFFFVSKSSSTAMWGWGMYYAGFLVNFPHFAASYQLLYRDAGKDFFAFTKHWKFSLKLWWAGVVMPLLLVAYMLVGLMLGSKQLLGYTVNAMFFFVGWHYIKQIFGCVVVLSATAKIYYTQLERWALLVPLYALWGLSFFSYNTAGSADVYYGMPYTSFRFPDFIIPVLYALLGLATFAMVEIHAWKFIRLKRFPPLSAVAALISIYVWFIPAFNHPHFALIIPFFHSLQYLLFVLAYKRNQCALEAPMHKHATHHAPHHKHVPRKTALSLTTVATALFILLPPVLIAMTIAAGFSFTIDGVMAGAYGMLMAVSSSLWLQTMCITGGLIILLICLRLAAKRSPLWHFLLFITHMLLLGALMFSVMPTILDILSKNALLPAGLAYSTDTFGAALYLFLFTIFVNIHHYFIDNVLWKRDNPHIRENLFAEVL